MKIFSSLIGIVLPALLLTNCQKKSDPEPNQTTKTEIISSAAWKYDNAGIDNNKDGTIDIPLSSIGPGILQACQTDNLITFKKDNSGQVDEGATKCNTADATTTNFNWNFSDNETNLNISNNVFSIMNGKSKIVALTNTNLSLSRDTTLLGSNYTLVVSLKH
ncbi:MAG: hypothetical protein EOO10_02240 [Chitinophagaceae bacterium]|nr:MAG: hypothetical protein EOO10_02240 [Chitinophagaceae bacterium]